MELPECALFGKQFTAEVTSCRIAACSVDSDETTPAEMARHKKHVEYSVVCKRVDCEGQVQEWVVWKRFSDFCQLEAKLRAERLGKRHDIQIYRLPWKRDTLKQLIFGVESCKNTLCAHRQIALSRFLGQLLKIPARFLNQHPFLTPPRFLLDVNTFLEIDEHDEMPRPSHHCSLLYLNQLDEDAHHNRDINNTVYRSNCAEGTGLYRIPAPADRRRLRVRSSIRSSTDLYCSMLEDIPVAREVLEARVAASASVAAVAAAETRAVEAEARIAAEARVAAEARAAVEARAAARLAEPPSDIVSMLVARTSTTTDNVTTWLAPFSFVSSFRSSLPFPTLGKVGEVGEALFASPTRARRQENATLCHNQRPRECTVCMEVVALGICAPCGHRCMCHACYDTMAAPQSNGAASQLPCPICRGEVLAFVGGIYDT
jgi:hypothetical protein